jgi:N-acetylneuraminic acid mutarotase
MVVWGGRADNFGTDLNTGGRYDPVADAWTPTTVLTAPQARRNHTAVWTGTRVIVWGGADPSPFNLTFNTGGRYDPATDTWKATTTVNAPEGRENHTAVWTGSAMLVWGGSADGAYLDTGGRYGLFAPGSTICTPSWQ